MRARPPFRTLTGALRLSDPTPQAKWRLLRILWFWWMPGVGTIFGVFAFLALVVGVGATGLAVVRCVPAVPPRARQGWQH